MSDSPQSSQSPLKVFLVSAGIFLSFGFLVLILSGAAGHESIEERSYQGEFDSATKEARWKNLEEVSAAQKALVDDAKLDAALASLAKSTPKGAASGIVVPGSPTFMKQMEDAAAAEKAASEAAAKKAEEEKKKASAPPAPAKPAPAEAKKPEVPKAAPASPKVEAPKAAPASPKKAAPEAAKAPAKKAEPSPKN